MFLEIIVDMMVCIGLEVESVKNFVEDLKVFVVVEIVEVGFYLDVDKF